ncbi:spinster family MFS transporter [Steroidobacter cummioxidans]|uniref:spinster family MFS transporter n=1 Tax=Steroidobacter cummioxidans TaxID=1803913 RepID=UPI000E30D06C|nr:MFS transporter [Steroidobacter cummioxidans]
MIIKASGQTRGAMLLLTLIYTLNFVDRQIINILAESIKVELALSDAQLGLLTGFSFALFYTVLGLPIARLADRSSRTGIISIAVFAWSFMTCLCGLAQSFAQMLLARVGVAVGESGCTPAAHSLISDWFPPQRRASALAMYSLGVPLGTLCGMALGGWIGHGLGWRAAFFIAGVPGMVLAVIAWWVLKEPPRREQPLPADQQASMLSVLAELSRSRALWCIAISMSLLSLLGYGQAAFSSASFFLFLRVHELAARPASGFLRFGLVLGFGGVAGVWRAA